MDASRAPAQAQPIRVLSLTGAGRSGSTFIGNILGQLPGAVHVGEMCYAWNRGVLRNELCGCGRPFAECPLWSAVVASPAVAARVAEAEELAHFPRAASRRLPLSILRGGSLDPRARRYAAALGELYAAIREVSGAEVIIDSSKQASHIWAQAAMAGIDLRIVQVLRDPRAVAFSWKREVARLDTREGEARQMERAGTAKGALKWAYGNWLIGMAARRSGRPFLRAKYEEVVRTPRDRLAAMARFMGMDPTGLPFESAHEVALAPTHTVWGNPKRLQTGTIRLRYDDEWTRAMSAPDRYLVTLLTWPLLRRYGY